MTENLGGRGNEGDQMGELSTELLDTGIVDQEEEVGLSLFWKTSSAKNQFGWLDGRSKAHI